MIDAKGRRAYLSVGGASAVVFLLLTSAPAVAQQPTSAQASAIRSACRGDYQANCAGVPTGGMAALKCLQQNAAKTSPGCQQALQAVSGAPAAAPKAAAPAPAAPAPAATPAPSRAAGGGGHPWAAGVNGR